jgi:hypothetical protein
MILAIGGILIGNSSAVMGQVLLDETWADGRRAETNRPKEAAVWVGRDADVTVKPGALTNTATPSSQKIWVYFTDKEPIRLDVGQKLVASVSFIPRGNLNETASRGLRIGVFHDPTSPRVEADTNSDAGGSEAPWTDAKGYAAQVLLDGSQGSRTKPFDLGKRTNFTSRSLLGTSGDYTKVSGGEPIALKPDKEYTVTLEVEKVSDREVGLTCNYKQGTKVLSTWSVVDDGDYLGTEPACDSFDLVFIRISNRATTADKLEFTNFRVELVDPRAAANKAKAS